MAIEASDKAFLEDLHERLWKSERGKALNTQALVPEEWARVTELIQKYKLAVEMGNSDFGFAIAIHIYDDPLYPGIPPTLLCAVTQRHLPLIGTLGNPDGWNIAWDVFSAITHTRENKQRLKAMGLAAPRGKDYYEY
jgi:hypothetical protein